MFPVMVWFHTQQVAKSVAGGRMTHIDKFKSLIPKSSPERFKYAYLALAFVCLALMLFVAVMVVKSQSYNDFMIYIENNSQKIADAICYTETEAIYINDHLKVPESAFNFLDAKLRDTYDSLDILNVAIISADHRILYSNNKGKINSVATDIELTELFATGKLISDYQVNQTIVDLMGEKREHIDVVEVYVPIKNVKGTVIGAFALTSNASELKSRYTKQLISSISVFVISVLFLSFLSFLIILRESKELKHAYSLLESLASTDVLTGIYNRTFFEAELDRLKSSRRYPVGVIVVDLDGLKEINDTRGHAAGDLMICKAAEVLKESVRSDDLVSRTGGDEFTILLPDTDVEGLKTAVERILSGLDEANKIKDDLEVKISLGSEIAETSDKLLSALKVADINMYENKSARKNVA
jgi:diguanylate cyclase (GGDEF)-like protein